MTSHLFTILLLGLSVGVYADTSEQQGMLRAFELSCKDCNTMQFGNDPAALTEHPCPTGTVCGPVSGAFACISEDSADAGSCSCSSQESAYMAEPYDPTKYIACLPDGSQSTLECSAGVFMSDSTENPPCGTGPECVAPATAGFNALLSDTEKCTKYFFCDAIPPTDADAIVPTFECPEGQVYDTSVLGCVDPCSLAPEPFACEPTDSGPFPDPEDCTIFHICFNGVKIGDPIPCEDGSYYDNTDMACKAGTSDPICTVPDINPCYEPYKAECA